MTPARVFGDFRPSQGAFYGEFLGQSVSGRFRISCRRRACRFGGFRRDHPARGFETEHHASGFLLIRHDAGGT